MTSEILRMSEEQLARARKLIRRKCCNYDNGICLLFDFIECNICPQWLTHSVLCTWFRDAVLPNDTSLKSELYRTLPAGYCKHCGKPFPANGRKIYCSDRCRNASQKKDTAARVRNYRKKKAEV